MGFDQPSEGNWMIEKLGIWLRNSTFLDLDYNSNHITICSSVAEVYLTDVAPLWAVRHIFNFYFFNSGMSVMVPTAAAKNANKQYYAREQANKTENSEGGK